MKLHALLGHPVSENFVSWCQTLKNSSASFLCIQETYNHLHDLAIWKWFKNVYIWSAFVLWCLDNWSRICQVSLLTHFPWLFFVWPSLHLFTATHTFLFLSFTIFFSWSVIGVFGLFSCEPRFMAHIDTPWFVKFSKMANINFCESWFGFFLN